MRDRERHKESETEMRDQAGQRQEKQTQEETNRDGGRRRKMLSFLYRP